MPKQVAQLGAGHLALEFRAGEHGGEEAVLVEQDAFVEGHVGDADGALVAQGGVVAVDGDFVDGSGLVGVEAAMAIVIADGVGGAEVGDPTGFEQGNQPGLMLAGYGDGPGDGQGEGAAHADGAVEDLVNPAQIGSAKGRQAVQEDFFKGTALIDSTGLDVAARAGTLVLRFVGHKLEHSRRRDKARS